MSKRSRRTARAIAVATITSAAVPLGAFAAGPDSGRDGGLEVERARRRTSAADSSNPFVEFAMTRGSSPYDEVEVPRVPWSELTSSRAREAVAGKIR